MHTYTPVIGLLNTVLHNPYLSCNLALLLSFSIGGLGAYLLAKEFLKSAVLAFLVGFIFAFSPYMSSHLQEHYHLMLVAAVPFFVRALLKLFKKGELGISHLDYKQLLIMISCFIITLFSDYYTSFFLLFSAIFYVLFLLLRKLDLKWNWWKISLLLFVLMALSHIIVEPMYLKGLDNKGAFYNTADFLSLIVPAENSFFYGNLFEGLRVNLDYKGPNEQVMFVGFVLLLLFLLVPRRERTYQINALRFLCLLFFFLCLPKIKIMGSSLSYSPTAWIHYVPFLNNIRNPTRFVAMLYLFIPILSFYHWEAWVNKDKLVQLKPFLTMVLFFAIILEYLPKSYSFYNKNQVNEYAEVIKDDQSQVLWNIPTGVGDGFKEVGHFKVQLLQDQIVHQKKYIGAYVSRLPQSLFTNYENELMFQQARLAAVQEPVLQLEQSEINHFLRKYQVDCIVLQKYNSAYQSIDAFVRGQFEHQLKKVIELKGQSLYYLEAAK